MAEPHWFTTGKVQYLIKFFLFSVLAAFWVLFELFRPRPSPYSHKGSNILDSPCGISEKSICRDRALRLRKRSKRVKKLSPLHSPEDVNVESLRRGYGSTCKDYRVLKHKPKKK